jgi:putative NIF3 family GTP cyclohydrolase 1 type 2
VPTSQDLIRFVESRTGHPLNEDEGIAFGRRVGELTGVTVTWMVNPETIAAAAAAGHNCIVHHEALTYPYPYFTHERERHYLSWPTNMQRLALLAQHGLTAIRMHASLDEIYIFGAFAEQLGLGEFVADDGTGKYPWHRVYESPVATFGELIEHVKEAVGMPALRCTHHPLDRPVKRLGLPWGGLGLFVNVHYVQGLIDLGIDTLICGESDNYGFRFPAELDIAVIETSHEVSEVRGLQQFVEALRGELGIDARFAPTPCIWTIR